MYILQLRTRMRRSRSHKLRGQLSVLQRTHFLTARNENDAQRMRVLRAALITFVSREFHSAGAASQRIIALQIPAMMLVSA
ncbi:hypothetical protein JQ604_38905 [Bradyrhizobium jicamae]|uniref:hypothetical protein n=1 Tax=Bradyrhizobium jicamae TaxID=280332 RepID=UPI001BAD73AB|nr:hypothetical protein [Bradyrhizobium jicamae]MBR0758187.1 hypothetical protein [Bradyrhizobium jicamae]